MADRSKTASGRLIIHPSRTRSAGLLNSGLDIVEQNLAYDLTIALIPGVMAGYYAGLLVAKLSKFNSLKYEALRAVRGIDYMGDATSTRILKSDKVEDLHLIGSELFQLKHKSAGETVSRISGEVLNAIAMCTLASCSVETMSQNIASWQKQLRKTRVDWRFFLPWGQV